MPKPSAELAIAGQYTERPSEGVVETVIEEIEALLVTRTKEAREYTMMVFWETGSKLREFEKRFKVSITTLVERVAGDNRISGRQMGARNLWFALRFADTYPKFEDVYLTEFGENVSLSKVKKMLVTPKQKKEKSVEEMAHQIVQTMGVEKARALAKAIEAECAKQD